MESVGRVVSTVSRWPSDAPHLGEHAQALHSRLNLLQGLHQRRAEENGPKTYRGHVEMRLSVSNHPKRVPKAGVAHRVEANEADPVRDIDRGARLGRDLLQLLDPLLAALVDKDRVIQKSLATESAVPELRPNVRLWLPQSSARSYLATLSVLMDAS